MFKTKLKRFKEIKALNPKQIRQLMADYKFDGIPTIHECFRKWSHRGQIVKLPNRLALMRKKENKKWKA